MPISSSPLLSFRVANGGLVGDPTRSSGAPTRWNDLGRRAVSASILAPVVLLCIWYGAVPFVLLIAVGAVGLSAEWVGLCRIPAVRMPGLLVPALILVSGAVTAFGHAGAGLVVLLASAALVWSVSRRLLLASGILYVGLAIVALLWLRGWPGADGRTAVFFVVLIVWASDIGAYVAGRLIGGPKLAPALSPAKTWSGAVGGLVTAMVIGEAVAMHVTLGTALFAALLAIVCQAGDLLESALKRHVGVKDSGRLIPGHGGLLDRLDGLLAAAPVAALVVLVSREGLF